MAGKSISFYFDELGKKEMKLKLNNDLLIERQGSSQHSSLNFYFNDIHEEIKNIVS
jgi:hypothetical protein